MTSRYQRWLLVGLLLATTAYALAEELVLITSYPSPLGVYQYLKVGAGYNLTTPATLQVVKPADDGMLAFRVDDQAEPEDPSPFVITEQGDVRIGTTTPSSFKLQVAGNMGPDASATYDLGSSLLSLRDGYFSGNVTAADPSAASHLVTKNFAETNYKDPPGQWTCRCSTRI